MSAETIDEVLEQLDAIIERSRRENSRLGYFAALYRNVTVRVRDGIAAGRFEDGPRMERLDVTFANRYFEAYRRYEHGGEVTRCWRMTFETADRWAPLILHHLLLGMNAHINLDLGVAAARTCPGEDLAGLEHDFREINALLTEMLDEVQDCLSELSPWFWLLDRAGGSCDELLAGLGLRGTREGAWRVADRLARLQVEQQAPVIEQIDGGVAVLGRILLRPGPLLTGLAFIARLAERKQVSEVIDALLVEESSPVAASSRNAR